MDAQQRLGKSGSTSDLEALPDFAFDIVLRYLYQTVPKNGIVDKTRPNTISALAATSCCLRNAVRRVRHQTCYELGGSAFPGRFRAEHLNSHTACTSVCVAALLNDGLFPSAVADFLCHISSSASLQVKHVTICRFPPSGSVEVQVQQSASGEAQDQEGASDEGQDQDSASDEGGVQQSASDEGGVQQSASDEGQDQQSASDEGSDGGPDGDPEGASGELDAREVLLLARAFPGMEALALPAQFRNTNDLFAGLAACCPHLRSLKVHMHEFRSAAIGSLSALRSLTSLALEEEHRIRFVDFDADGDRRGLLQQLSALSALTHLRLKMGTRWGLDLDMPALGHTQLRSLELACNHVVDVYEFAALAAAFPCLEQLHCHSLSDDLFGDAGYYWGCVYTTIGPVDWCMPHLRVISFAEGAREPGLHVEGLLHLAGGCPALRDLSNVTVRDATFSRQGQFAAADALRWLQGLGTVAGRGLLGGAELVVLSAEHVDAFCAAVEQFQPAAGSAEVAARIQRC